MSTRKKHDIFFIIIILTLVLFGFFVLSSASLGLASQANKNSYVPLLKQLLIGGGLGSILFFITSRFHYKKWRRLSLPFFVFSLFVTILVFAPHVGLEHGGAKRWLSLGITSFQPAELLKFAFVIYLCSWLAKKQKDISTFKTGLIPFFIIMSIAGTILIFQPDMGTLIVIAVTGGLLFLLAGARFAQVGTLLLVGLVLLSALAFSEPYRRSRMAVFFDNSYDLQGEGYQLNQAKIAIGSGGMFGKGFGEGLSKYNYLPEPTGDSIFAIVGEEFGYIGSIFLISLFLIFFFKVVHVALKTNDVFGRLLALGIAILIIVQSFINISAIVGLIPLTGLPLIFISHGGSALALSLAEVGIIYNISKNNRK
ncbi:putative lipid II flippase FtsW [Patescibacteria group bacterium]